MSKKTYTKVDNNTIFATMSLDGYNPQGIIKSEDGGENWTLVNNGIFGSHSSNIDRMIYNSKTGDLFVGERQDGVVYRSTDLGESWVGVITGLSSAFGPFAVDPITGHTYVCDIISGVNRFLADSTDGDGGESLWEPTSVPMFYADLPVDERDASAIAVANNGDVWVATIEGIFLSTNNGDTWVTKDNGLPVVDYGAYRYGPIIQVLATSPLYGYIFTSCTHYFNNNTLYRSTDNGDNWTSVLDLKDSNIYVSNIVFTPSGEIYATTIPWSYVEIPCGGIYYSNDNGNTWVKKNNGLPSEGSLYINSLFLGIDGTLYAYTEGAIYHSTDGGDNWIITSNTRENITDFTVANDGSIFAAANYSGVLKSTDGGFTWNRFNTGLNIGIGLPRTVEQIIYNPITEHLFLSMGYSMGAIETVYRSTNLGENWVAESGLPIRMLRNNDLRAFAVNSKTGMLFIAYTRLGYGNDYGIYRSILQKTISVKEPPIPKDETNIIETKLFTNYPNPFNPSTVIKYQLAKASQVSLKVYDVMGREVATLVNSFQNKGSYDVTFDAKGLASGIYFYKLNAGGKQFNNKMLLMK